MWRDLTHLTEAPPDIPKHIHFSTVFFDIFIHPFICSTVQREATPWETTTSQGHVTRRLGRQVALNSLPELWIVLMTARDETEEEEGEGWLYNLHTVLTRVQDMLLLSLCTLCYLHSLTHKIQLTIYTKTWLKHFCKSYSALSLNLWSPSCSPLTALPYWPPASQWRANSHESLGRRHASVSKTSWSGVWVKRQTGSL